MVSNDIDKEVVGERVEELNGLKEQIKVLFDLSEKEVEVYISLLRNDKLTAAELSKQTGIQRTRTYEIFRRLKEKELVRLSSDNPQRYSVVSPRIAIDNWLLKSRRLLEEKRSSLFSLLPVLQKMWNDQHEELFSSRISLISEDLVRDIIPQEINIARKKLCLALRDPPREVPASIGVFQRFFDLQSFNEGIRNFLKRGVVLQLLLGDPEAFIENAHPTMLKTLVNGLIEGTIEVRVINEPFPQSFLLVDDERIYLFFLNVLRDVQNEAIRAESQSLRDFFKLVWQKFWDDATPLDIEAILKRRK